MSRSFRKTNIVKDNPRISKFLKRKANKRIRHMSYDLLRTQKSTMHKRFTDSWNIHDYICYWPKDEAIADWYREEVTCQLNGYDLSSYGWHKQYTTLSEFIDKGWKPEVYWK